jgi:hypothetical protein
MVYIVYAQQMMHHHWCGVHPTTTQPMVSLLPASSGTLNHAILTLIWRRKGRTDKMKGD